MKRTIVILDQQRAQRANEIINALVPKSDESQVYEARIQVHKSSRSLAQNNLFHAWCREASAVYFETRGKLYPPAYWKMLFKLSFLGEETFKLPDGREVTQVISTSGLLVDEFAKFLEQVDHYCGSELHIFLSRPEDYHRAMGKAA